jgi:Pyruvate-formate lyase-activating enzyme
MDRLPVSREALYWEKEPEDGQNETVRCRLCPRSCLIRDGATGACRVRTNRGGILEASSYGVISSLALDPIEKKPLARFYPGSRILSAGSFGCNLSCLFCQNHEISQVGLPGGTVHPFTSRRFRPDDLVNAALESVPDGNIGLAYTYNEPLVSFEFVRDAARGIRQAGLKNVLVTNGYVNQAPLRELAPLIDAMNIDLKAFTDDFYRDICGGRLEPVKETISTVLTDFRDCHVEITTLVIPGRNSSPEEIAALSGWLASLSGDVTLHLTRHHPDFRMPEPPSIGREELLALAEVARTRLGNVFCGNMGL